MTSPSQLNFSFSSSASSVGLVPSSSFTSTSSSSSTPSGSPIQLMRDVPERKVSRNESKMILNERDLGVRDEKWKIQKKRQDLQIEERWINSFTSGILIDLERIIKKIHLNFDKDNLNTLLIEAQKDLEAALVLRSQEADDYINDLKILRMKEGVDGVFTEFIEKSPKVNKIKKIIEATEKTNNKHDQSTIDSRKVLVEIEEEIDSEIDPGELEAINIKYKLKLKRIQSKDEKTNKIYKKIKEYVLEYEFRETDKIVSKNAISKAKISCKQYIQIYPLFILDMDQFYANTQLSFLDADGLIQDPTPKTKHVEITKKKFFGNVLTCLKVWIEKYEEDKIAINDEIERLRLLENKYNKKLRDIINCVDNKIIDIFELCKYHSFEEFQKDLLKLLHDESFSINHCHDVKDRTLLHLATDRNTLNFTKLLFTHGARSDIFNVFEDTNIPYTFTPLHRAAANCNYEALDYLLAKNKEIINTSTKSTNSKHYHSLHFVIRPQLMFKNLEDEKFEKWQNGAYRCVELLCKNGALITGFYAKSIFVHSIDEYISYCKKSASKEYDLTSLKKSISTLRLIINFFLKNPNLPGEDLLDSIKSFEKASNRFTDEEINKDISQIFAEIFKHVNFTSNYTRKIAKLSFSSAMIDNAIQEHLKNNHVTFKRNSTSLSSQSSQVLPRSHSNSTISKKPTFSSNPISATVILPQKESNSPTESPRTTPTTTPTTTPRATRSKLSRASTSPMPTSTAEQGNDGEQSGILRRIRFGKDKEGNQSC